MRTHIHTCVYISIYVYVHGCVHIRMHVCMHTYICVYIYVDIHINLSVSVRVRMYSYVCICTHISIHEPDICLSRAFSEHPPQSGFFKASAPSQGFPEPSWHEIPGDRILRRRQVLRGQRTALSEGLGSVRHTFNYQKHPRLCRVHG